MSISIDLDDLQDRPMTGPDALHDLIVAQSQQEMGIFVLLFTSDSMNPTGTADGEAAGRAAELVAEQAGGLGLDLDRLTLFSDDAYLLQSVLGAVVVAESA